MPPVAPRMEKNSVTKISISLSGSLLERIDEHCTATHQDRSGYIRAVVHGDLERHQQCDALQQVVAEAVQAGVDVAEVLGRSMREAVKG